MKMKENNRTEEFGFKNLEVTGIEIRTSERTGKGYLAFVFEDGSNFTTSLIEKVEKEGDVYGFTTHSGSRYVVLAETGFENIVLIKLASELARKNSIIFDINKSRNTLWPELVA